MIRRPLRFATKGALDTRSPIDQGRFTGYEFDLCFAGITDCMITTQQDIAASDFVTNGTFLLHDDDDEGWFRR
jgi:hypothetical protein